MLWRRGVSAVAGVGLAAALPAAFAFSPEPVYANALPIWDQVEELASATSSDVTIPGGAGKGLASVIQLAGRSLSVSGEVAGATSAGAIELTPVGWAIDAGMIAAGAGSLAYANRGAIISAVNSVWNSLSSTQQSNLESQNSPGSAISLPQGAIASYVNSLAGSSSSSYAQMSSGFPALLKVTVPDTVPVGGSVGFGWSSPVPSGAGSTIFLISSPGGSWNASYSSSSWGSGLYGKFFPSVHSSSWSVAYMAPGSVSATGKLSLINVKPGQVFYIDLFDNINTTNGLNNSSIPSGFPSSVPYQPTTGSEMKIVNPNQFDFLSGSTNWTVSVSGGGTISSSSVPSSVTAPDPSSSSRSFWPGTWSNGHVAPAYNPGGAAIVNPAPVGQANPYAPSTPVQHLPTGSPAPGFVTFIEDLVVPTANQIAQTVSPLTSAFADRIPFSYVTALIGLMPSWADGLASGGCAAFPIPEFGLNDNSNYHVQICQSSFIGSALSALKSAFSVLIWMFLLGWGVMMFRRLVR